VTADAVLYPLEQATLVPKISAPVRKFYVNRGSKVRAGELLATLDNKDLSAALVENKGAYDQAQAQYDASTKVNLPAQIQAATLDAQNTQHAMEAAESVYKSRQQLYKSGAIARNLLDQSQVAYVQARSQYEIAQANLKSLQAVGKDQQLKSAEGQLKSAEGRYQAAQAQYGYSEIRSPINGVVAERPLFAGETATAGTPLVTVMDTSTLIAKAHIAQSQAQELKLGGPATITAPGVDKAVSATVSMISPALDAGSTTVEIWLKIDNRKATLKAGTPVHAVITGRSAARALMIPANAVQTAPDGSKFVMVVGSNGTAQKKPVTLGIGNSEDEQVTSGLTAADNVITAGAYALDPGTKVQIVPAPAAGADSGGGAD